MRAFAVIMICAYSSLAIFGVAALPHMAHGACPFSTLAGDCALLASPFGVLNHINGFWLTVIALPVFLALFFAVAFFAATAGILPPAVLLQYERRRAENIFLPAPRIFRRWLSLVSAYS